MEIAWAIAQFVIGFIFLVGGAELLIRGASRIALRFGVQPIIIGLTIVAFGASAPELLVSVTANLGNASGSDLAIGNIIGSNIANLGLILGLCGSVYALSVNRHIVKIEYPLMAGVTVAFSVMMLGGILYRWEGLLLFAGLIAFLVWNIITARRQYEMAHAAEENLEAATTVDAKIARPSEQPWFDGLLIVMGLGGLVLGADWLVTGSRTIALAFGVSEMVIGLTLVAVGTSLPEAATSDSASSFSRAWGADAEAQISSARDAARRARSPARWGRQSPSCCPAPATRDSRGRWWRPTRARCPSSPAAWVRWPTSWRTVSRASSSSQRTPPRLRGRCSGRSRTRSAWQRWVGPPACATRRSTRRSAPSRAAWRSTRQCLPAARPEARSSAPAANGRCLG